MDQSEVFPVRSRQIHSARLPPNFSYVPPTPNNFAPAGSIYDGYEAFKAANTPSLYRFSTTFQNRKRPDFPGSIESHEDALRKLEADVRPLSSHPLHVHGLEYDGLEYDDLVKSGLVGANTEVRAAAASRTGHDLFKPGSGSFVERPVNPYLRSWVEDAEAEELHPYYWNTHHYGPHQHWRMNSPYYYDPYWYGHVPDLAAEPPAAAVPQVHEALRLSEERALFGDSMPWWNWHVVTDRPMDMPTKAEFITSDHGALFKGSLRNNLPSANMDSWASVRSADTWLDLSALSGIQMAVRGDGKTYRAILRTKDTYGTIEYTAVIPAKPSAHKWRTVQLSWNDFRPCYKAGMISGVDVDQVPPLDPRNIKNFGFGVGDRQWGPFHLEIKFIKAVE
jgi:hypothetical protein